MCVVLDDVVCEFGEYVVEVIVNLEVIGVCDMILLCLVGQYLYQVVGVLLIVGLCGVDVYCQVVKCLFEVVDVGFVVVDVQMLDVFLCVVQVLQEYVVDLMVGMVEELLCLF